MLSKKVMAFLIVPLLFALLGYSIIYLSLKPAADFSISMVTSMIADSSPDFRSEERRVGKVC